MMRYRIYTSVKKIGEDYYEAKYKEYVDDKLKCCGTEDFSTARLRKATKTYRVYKHNGKTMHGAYREGYKMTDCIGYIRMSLNAVAIKAAKMMYGKDVVRVSK